MTFAMWQLWLIIGLLLLLADVFVAGGASGVLLVLGLGALGGMVGALLGLEPTGQIMTAVVASVVSLPFVVWMLRRATRGNSGNSITDPRIANSDFEVIEQRGRLGIRVLGDFFPVRTVDGSAVQVGDKVRVDRFEGIVAVVKPQSG
ncbi:membrane protein implicated in regulation of membrane protease activity [Natronocella acetinitrilica]|uniref:Membrane protein implicated in regulation of membrane protease activity n=1 Tax=Natronocella acetinitrilica TaxID=414046 RepID=A0AAE3G2H0_9GAMM|nr:NfeD family protein [Natronocella acetinitrilica]MCP1673228.1 membrane protein implicated in regulation of membrane protease activity [Natronocella acetinitrilica]